MKKQLKKLVLSRETLRHLTKNEVGRTGIRGGDNKDPYTRTLLPSDGGCDSHADCTHETCPQSLTCDSVVIC